MGNRALRDTSRRMLFALLFTGAACAVAPGTGALEAPRPFVKPATLATSADWRTTEQLVADPLTREKVNKLHALTLMQGMKLDPTSPHGYVVGLVPTLASKETGISGSSGPEWLAFHDVESTISTADAKALIHHEDPVIRGYFIWHASESSADELATELYPMLGDETPLTVQSGCTGSLDTVSGQAMQKLSRTERGTIAAERRDLFEMVAQDDRLTAKVRGVALDDLAFVDPVAARSLAKSAALGTDEKWKREGVRVLGSLAGSGDVELFGDAVKSADAQDRATAARALGKIQSQASTDLLAPLLKDPDQEVQAAAARSYASQSTADDAIIKGLLNRSDQSIPFQASYGLMQRGTMHELQMLEPMLMSDDPKVDAMELGQLISKVGPPSLPTLRRLLASPTMMVRIAVVEHLGSFHDEQSIPALRKMLAGRDLSYMAADALGNIDAKEAAPDLAAALTAQNPNTRIAAAKALAKLRAVEQLPALEKAASSDTTFAKPEIVNAVAALKAL